MSTKQELLANVHAAREQLGIAQAALEAFETAPENNVFASISEAESVLEDRLEQKAFDDCQGAHHCGQPTYTQEFIVDDKRYMATLKLEYNRHDKMYYYIEELKFSVAPITP